MILLDFFSSNLAFTDLLSHPLPIQQREIKENIHNSYKLHGGINNKDCKLKVKAQMLQFQFQFSIKKTKKQSIN